MNRLEEFFIDFETAKLARRKGFDLPTENYYDTFFCLKERGYSKAITLKAENRNNRFYFVSMPSKETLKKWLKDKHDIILSDINPDNNILQKALKKILI